MLIPYISASGEADDGLLSGNECDPVVTILETEIPPDPTNTPPPTNTPELTNTPDPTDTPEPTSTPNIPKRDNCGREHEHDCGHGNDGDQLDNDNPHGGPSKGKPGNGKDEEQGGTRGGRHNK